MFYPFCFHLNELLSMPYLRHAISIYERMNCIESHYLLHKAYRCDVLRRLLALAEKTWNETNLQEVAQEWLFKRNLETSK